MKKIQVGSLIKLYSLKEIEDFRELLNVEVIDEEIISFENVDVYIEQIKKMDMNEIYKVSNVDEDGDFQIKGFYMTFANEMVKEIVEL